MGLFDDMLNSGETLIRNEESLDFEFVPKLMPYRETQHKYIAECIKPLFQERSGRNLFVSGLPGIGKTAAVKSVFRELEDKSDDIVTIYINCWQKNTTYKIMIAICEEINYRLTHNKKTEELFRIVKGILNKQPVVFAFDEVDKLEDVDFLYTITEEIYKKSIILVTNYKEWIMSLDQRIKSRFNPEMLHFGPYTEAETKGILKERLKYAFVPGVWEEGAFDLVARKTFELRDIRQGLFLLKESALCAEDRSSKKIVKTDAEKAIAKIGNFSLKSPEDLEDDTRLVLDVVKKNSGKRIGELFEVYKKEGGAKTYKTFQRKIEKLEQSKFIATTKTAGGAEGNTTIVTLHDF